MYYFIIPVVLSVYFELFGRWVASKFKNVNFRLYYPLGFFSVLAIIYPTLLLSINNCSFFVLMAIYGLLFVASIVLIVKDFNKLDHSIGIVDVLIVVVITVVLTIYSSKTTLGNLHGFDTLLYLNFTTDNIGLSALNSKGIYLNGLPEISMTYYSGQVYYYFAGVIIYIFGKIATLLKIEYFYMPAFVWTFQLLFDLILAAVIVECFYKVKNKLYLIVPSLIVILVFGRLYYNNVYGFFGNSYLALGLSYVAMMFAEYFKDHDKKYRYLIYIYLLGLCSMTSSGIYSLLFFLFGMYFFMTEDENILKEYSLVLLLPLINALNMERFSPIVVYLVPFVICAVLFFAGKAITSFIKSKKLEIPLLILCFLITFGLSRIYSNGLLDFSGFLNNLSQTGDMTLDYFSFADESKLIITYKIFILSLFGLTLIINHKKPLVMLMWLLIIAFFNPFSCNVLNHFVSVYYRAYSIIINPFTILMCFDALLNVINNEIVDYVVCLVVLIVFALNIQISKPIYYHYEHIPSKNYDFINKMDKDAYDVIKELKELNYYYDESNPYIITGNLLTQSMITSGKYLYGRTYVEGPDWSRSEKELFNIFYTPDYLGDTPTKGKIDYDNMLKYIDDAEIDYVVVDKNVEYYDKEIDDYYYFYFKVNKACDTFPVYENNTYAIYYFGDKG